MHALTETTSPLILNVVKMLKTVKLVGSVAVENARSKTNFYKTVEMLRVIHEYA